MFVCDKCQEVSKPNQSCNLIVIEKRNKDYEYTVIRGTEEKKFEKVYRSKGWEIVREQKTCQACIQKDLEKQPGYIADTRELHVKPRHKDEVVEEFKIKLPYDIQPSNFRKLEGVKEFQRK